MYEVPQAPNLYAAVKGGNELEILKAARDNLAKIMATCRDHRSYASLNKQLLDTLKQITEVEQSRAVGTDKTREVKLHVLQRSKDTGLSRAKNQARAKAS